MEDVIVYRGKEYTKEEIAEIARQTWKDIKTIVIEVFCDIFEAITSAVETFIKVLSERGYTEEQVMDYLETIIQTK